MSDNKKPIKPARPFSMEYAEAKNKIINAINEATQIHGVPFYLLEEIIGGISRQVKECAMAEYEKAKANYTQQLADYEQQGG